MSWNTRALEALATLAQEKTQITSDDLHSIVGDPPHHNQMGHVFHEAKAQGLIEATGRITRSKRLLAKGRNIQIWRPGKALRLFSDV